MNKYSDISTRKELYSLKNCGSISPRWSDSSIKLPMILRLSELSPDPVLSLKLARKESFCGISPLSQNQNIEFKKLSVNIFPSSRRTEKLSLIESPNHRDFSTILSQINSIVSDKTRNRYFLLSDEEPVYQYQNSGLPVFYKVDVKGKKCPLYVNLKKYFGHPVVYVSFTEIHPRPGSYDKLYYKSFFEVNDKCYEFKSSYLYMGVFSETDCKYRIEIAFGKYVNRKEYNRDKNLQDLQREVQEMLEKQSSASIKNKEKNFVEANKEINKGKGPEQLGSIERLSKRDEIIKKKKRLQKEKRLKAIESIHKKELREIEEATVFKYKKNSNSLKRFQQKLIFMFCVMTSAYYLREKTRIKRQAVLSRISKSIKVFKIQQFIKKKIKYPIEKLGLVICLNSLMMFKNTCSLIVKRKLRGAAFQLIKKTKENLVVYRFCVFSKKVLKIQIYFKGYLKKRHQRLNKIYELLERHVDKMAFKAKLKRDKLRYNSITASSKMMAVNEYYLSCVFAFYSDLRKLNWQEGRIRLGLGRPKFIYIPSGEILSEIVKEMLLSTDKGVSI